MKRKLIVGALSLLFVGSAALTALTHAAPQCLRCKKSDCPPGYCWVDCVNCCYITYGGDIVCFK
ncbi:MAG TPA: hypothetical protein VFU38_10485 [Candidatus Krumholzibacteria bacterium]|nr:hypothetical protein [Candidatus Krumholzibacteria bacterium]